MSNRQSVAQKYRVLGSFLRLPLFGWSLTLPILGILTASHVELRAGVIAVAMAGPFHVVLAVVNDLADIEVDRGDPRKIGRPLVSGAIRPSTAVLFVIFSVVAGFVADLVLLGADLFRTGVLALAFGGTAIYNLAGKQTRFPPFMDFLQGVGAAAFAYYGAMAAGSPSGRTLLVSVCIVAFITFINGVHAGLRDLTSDSAAGARTTPMLLGARPSGHEAPYISRLFIVYAWVLQFLLTALSFSEFIRPFVDGFLPVLVAGVLLCFTIVSFASLFLSLNSSADMSRRYFFASIQMLAGFGMVATVAGGISGGATGLVIFTALLLPLVVKRSLRAPAAFVSDRHVTSGR